MDPRADVREARHLGPGAACREGSCYFQRSKAHPPSGDTFGPPVRFESVKQKNGRTEEYLHVGDVEGIVACAEADSVEFHGWGSRAGAVETPDRMVIDLDPGEGVGFESVSEAALQLRRAFDAIGLSSFALLSGGKGVHVVVPIRPEHKWAQVREFAKTFCAALAEAAPQRFTIALPKAQRRGRIFLDFLRNQRTATAILPYSARARDGAPVAAPVAWDELASVERSDLYSIADVEVLRKRAASGKLRGWGAADQSLPSIR